MGLSSIHERNMYTVHTRLAQLEEHVLVASYFNCINYILVEEKKQCCAVHDVFYLTRVYFVIDKV